MTFSVLLSVYEKENPDYLDKALGSIWDNQTKKPDQIVLVKDGTLTKELDDKISEWSRKLGGTLTIAALPLNAGLGAALNEGLKHCRNDLVARMDSDDISLPDRFEKQIEYFVKNPDLALISGYISEFNEQPGDISSIRKVPLGYDKIVKRLKWRNAFNHMTVMYKKEAVLSVGAYNEKAAFFEDYDLWIRLLQAGYKADNIPEILVQVRIGNDMIGRRHGLSYIKKEKYFLSLQRERNFLSGFEYGLLLLTRMPLRLTPRSILNNVYKLLRSK